MDRFVALFGDVIVIDIKIMPQDKRRMHPQIAAFWTAIIVCGFSIFSAVNHYFTYTNFVAEYGHIPMDWTGFIRSAVQIGFLLVMSLLVVITTLLGVHKILRSASLVFLAGASIVILMRLGIRFYHSGGIGSPIEIAWSVAIFSWYVLLFVVIRWAATLHSKPRRRILIELPDSA